MSSLKVFISCAFVSWFALISTAHAKTYAEADGIVIVQTESENAQGGWSRENSISGHSGTGYLVWKGSDSFSESTAGRGTITYKFRIQRAGNYQMRWRSRITRGNNSTEHNDSWVRFPSGKNISGEQALSGWSKVYMNTLNKWVWQSSTVDNVGRPLRQYFSAGDHTMQISGRSSGHAIDRISLYRYAEVDFSASKFDRLSDSNLVTGSTTDNTPTPAPEPTPEPAPETTPEPTPTPTPEPVPTLENVVAPSVSVTENVLSWPAVEANAVNVHRGTGKWLESLPATQTQWQAPAAGTYYLVATGNGSWETWGRSDTVSVAAASTAAASTAAASTAAASTAADDSQSLGLSVQVYSSSALELFWNNPGIPDTFFEVQRNGERVRLGAQRSFFDDELQSGTLYNYSILVVDVAGNVLQTESISATTQGSAGGNNNPAAGSLMLAGEVYSQTAIELFWNTDDIDASSTQAYQIYLDGRLIGENYGRSLFIDTLSAGTAYAFSIGATDTRGTEVLSNVVVLDTYGVDTP